MRIVSFIDLTSQSSLIDFPFNIQSSGIISEILAFNNKTIEEFRILANNDEQVYIS